VVPAPEARRQRLADTPQHGMPSPGRTSGAAIRFPIGACRPLQRASRMRARRRRRSMLIGAPMQDPELHPDDAAAMRHGDRHPEPLRQPIANATMALYKEHFEEHFGKGPSDCRAFLERDIVVLVLNGGYTPAEHTLFQAGKSHDVRRARLAWQDSMEVRFIYTVERLTGRTSDPASRPIG
jgi:uncharacterized protein YbcI